MAVPGKLSRIVGVGTFLFLLFVCGMVSSPLLYVTGPASYIYLLSTVPSPVTSRDWIILYEAVRFFLTSLRPSIFCLELFCAAGGTASAAGLVDGVFCSVFSSWSFSSFFSSFFSKYLW